MKPQMYFKAFIYSDSSPLSVTCFNNNTLNVYSAFPSAQRRLTLNQKTNSSPNPSVSKVGSVLPSDLWR